MQEARNGIFEVMRLVAMFMVVLEHGMLVSAKYNTEPLGIIDNIGWLVGAFCVCAVNIFFLLTGYFARIHRLNLERLAGVWGKTLIYSVGIYLVFSIISQDYSLKEGIGYFFPILTKKYWFVQTYIVLAILAPFLLRIVESLSMRYNATFIAILLVMFCVHETFFQVKLTLDVTQGYGIIWACVLLFVGKFIRRIEDDYITGVPVGVYLVSYVLLSIIIFMSNVLIVKYGIAGGVTSRGNFYAYNSLTVFIQSVALFCFFVKISKNTNFNHSIVKLGRNVLAVYLISSHPLLLGWIWNDLLGITAYWEQPMLFVVVAIFYALCIMVVCFIIDIVLDYLLQPLSGYLKTKVYEIS